MFRLSCIQTTCLGMLLAMGNGGAQTGPALEIRADDSKVILAWPATATGFRLETASDLAAPEWVTVPLTPQTVGDQSQVERVLTGSVQFFRLFSAGTATPSLAVVSVDKTVITAAETAHLRFHFEDPDADFDTLIVTRSNWTGVSIERIPNWVVGLEGAIGEFNQPLNTRLLASGVNRICVSLEDAGGRRSAEECFEVTLGGGGAGTAPQITTFTPQSAEQRLPEGRDKALREFGITWNDGESDVERIRVRVTPPGGPAFASEIEARPLGFIDAGGTVNLPLLRLASSDAPGRYLVEATLVDAQGNIGNTVASVIAASRDSGEELLSATEASVEHNGDPSARTLLVRGSGFDTSEPEQNLIQLNGVMLGVVEATETTLRAALPLDAMPGFVRVSNRRGSAWVPEQLGGLPLELGIVPENPGLSPGVAQVFTAKINNRPTQKVTWSVNGITGGNVEVGFISDAGEYFAPQSLPAEGFVTLTAVWQPNPSVVATVNVSLLPEPPKVGAGAVNAEKGGVVVTLDGRANVELPPGTLASDAIVSLRLLEGPNRPQAPEGRRILAAFEVTAEAPAAAKGRSTKAAAQAAAFRAPAGATVPLSVGQAPGTNSIPNLQMSVSGVVIPEAASMVSSDGGSVRLMLPGPGVVLVTIPVFVATLPPVLNSISACSRIEEGRSVAFRLFGENLTPSLEAETLNQRGDPTLDVIPGTLFTRGAEAGITLHIQPIRNLRAGLTQSYTLVLRDSSGFSTRKSFEVHGLDELELQPGQRLVWDQRFSSSAPQRYSDIFIPATATLEIGEPWLEGGELLHGIRQGGTLYGGVFRVESAGPVRIHGAIDGHGANGQPGYGFTGGGATALAGAGGTGRREDGCDHLIHVHFLPEGYLGEPGRNSRCAASWELAIGDSARDRTDMRPGVFNSWPRHGFGGGPGKNTGLLADIGAVLDAIASIFSSALDFVGCVTTGTTCALLIADVAQAVDAVNDLVEHFDQTGFSGRPGQPGEPARLSGQLRGHSGGGGGGGGHYDYVIGLNLGGGGGAGGGGGRGVSIATASDIFYGGSIDTRGGNGGTGAEDGDRRAINPNLPPAPGRFSGGGGGAGSGGDIALRALGSIQRGFGSSINSSAGAPGIGGALFPHPNGGRFLLAHPETRQAEDGRQDLRAGAEPSTRELVLTRRLYQIRGDNRDRSTLIIRGENGEIRRVTVRRSEVIRLALFDGFNRIYDERDEGGSDLLQRCVLVLPDGVAAGPDGDGDGLGLNDELDLGTDPNRADTDGDGVNDYLELISCRNPRVAEPPGFASDRDCDGWPDAFETAAGSSADDPAASPGFTLLANPLLRVTRLENSRPDPVLIRRGSRPTTVSAPKPLLVARPSGEEAGVLPSTTASLPYVLQVARPVATDPEANPSTTIALPPKLEVEAQR